MIVARGMGRRASGATGIIVAAGLGLVLIPTLGGGGGIPRIPRDMARQQSVEFRKLLDDMDVLEIIPIVVEVINVRR